MQLMRYLGARIRRNEDPRLLQGAGSYAGDLHPPQTLHAGFARSPHAHARILAVDLSGALDVPGTVAAYAAADLPELARPTPVSETPPGLKGHGFFPLATDRVRYVGEPVAVVLAETPAALADALEAVAVEYEVLTPVLAAEPLAGNPLVWDDVPDNLAVDLTTGFGEVDSAFDSAEVLVEETFTFARAAGAAIEPRAVLAVPGGEGEPGLALWDSTQAPHNVRNAIASYLGLGEDALRVVTPDVGGGFGPKGRVYPEEYVTAALALRHARPISFVATRTEDFLTTAQGGGQVVHARLAADCEGRVLGIRHHVAQDAGAYTSGGGLGAPMNTLRHLMGPYRVPAAEVRLTGHYTNKVMTSPLRGGGRQYGIYVMERLLDRLAERLGLDRAEIRRRNFIPPEAFPYDTGMPSAAGRTVVYDSGCYPAYLERALQTVGYERFQGEQQEARAQGRYLGLGLAAFIESTGAGSEGARIDVGEDGAVAVTVGSPSTGQGHGTTFAQMAAERLGASLDAVTVRSGDTGAFGWGTGTFASRMGQFGGNAVSLAASEVREKALELAAEMLEIAPQDLELVDGWVGVRGLPARGVALGEVAREAVRRGRRLQAESAFTPDRQNTWAGGVNAAIVEVDVETGRVHILRYLVVHDSGMLVNPTIVEGQIHGGVVHGIGNALLEACTYDQSGQPATATFADYMLPGTCDVPTIETIHFETPSPFNPEGIKGAGEGGTIAAIPTIVSAVENALTPFGIKLDDIPLRAEDLALAVARWRTPT